MSKLGLGTVQFGMKYGIANETGKIIFRSFLVKPGIKYKSS